MDIQWLKVGNQKNNQSSLNGYTKGFENITKVVTYTLAKKISNLTGLIITKLDTSAKGGILLAICKRFGLPIIAVGMGEKETDLHPFNSADFSKILVKN